MKPSRAALTVILLGCTLGLAQEHKKPEPPKPLSPYMRKVGLLYLGTLDSARDECFQDCKRLMDIVDRRFDHDMDSLNDKITIDLDEQGRPEGDKPTFELLKQTKEVYYSFLSELYIMQIKHGQESQWLKNWSDIASVLLCFSTHDCYAGNIHETIG